MKIIKLTNIKGKICCVNFSEVEYFEKHPSNDNLTMINFNHGSTCVQESPEEIYDKLYPIVD